MYKNLLLVGLTSVFLAACGGDSNNNSTSGGGGSSSGGTAASDGVYTGNFMWRSNNNSRPSGSITFTFKGDTVSVRRANFRGTATFSGSSYSVTESTTSCAWVYDGTVANGTTSGTISAVRCPATVTGSYNATRP